MGRWINRDPLEELGSILLRRETEKKIADLNLYGFVGNNPIINVDPMGMALYEIYWDQYGASLYYVGCVKVKGTACALEKSTEGECACYYECVDFEGTLCGGSIGLPGGTFSNVEIFEDSYSEADVRRVAGRSCLLSGSAAFDDTGISAGGYKFGDLIGTKKTPSSVKQGYDLGVDFVFGWTHLRGDTYCVDSLN